MERSRDQQNIKDKTTQDAFEHVFRNALGNPIVLDSAPTKEGMKANTVAKHGTDIYFKTADGTVLKITGVEVT